MIMQDCSSMYLDGRKAYWDVAHAKSLRDW